MAGPLVTLGRQRTNNSGPDYLGVGVNQQRVTLTNPMQHSKQVIISRIEAWVGRTGGTNAIGRYGVFGVVDDGAHPGGVRPDALLGSTDEFTASTVYVGSNGGALVGANLTTPVLLAASTRIAFGAGARQAPMGLSMAVAANINEPNESLYTRTISGTTLQTAAGSTYSNEGQVIMWALAEENVAPNQPGALVRSGGSTNQQPTITATFSDTNETLRNGVAWDRLEAHYTEVWWGGQRRWKKTAVATAGERNARQSSVQIGVGGDTDGGMPASISIPFDTPATVVHVHIDRGGEWSVARYDTFTIYSGGSVDKPTSPPAWVNVPSAPGNVTAIYRNTSGLNADRMQVQIYNSAGSLLGTSPLKTVSVAPNGTLNMTWVETGFVIGDGTVYGIAVNARSTNGQWSGYGEKQWFRTNARPYVPSVYSPTEGAASSAFPDIGILAGDPDGNNPIVNVQIQTSGGVLVWSGTLLAPPYIVYPAVHGISPGYGTYRVRVQGADGYLESDWSAWRNFTVAAVPSVTITGPSSPVATATPTLAWTAPTQTAFRLVAYNQITGQLVYDTGDVISSSQKTHTIDPAGYPYWKNGYRWRNGDLLGFVVFVRNASNIWGQSAGWSVELSYPPIAGLIINGSAMAYTGIDGTHYAQITTSASTYPQGQFRGYHRRRVEISGFMGSEIAGTEIALPTSMSGGDTTFNDYHMKSNQWYRYTVWQEIAVGNDLLDSPSVSIDLMASWYGVILFSHADPMQPVWLKYGAAGGQWEPSVSESPIRRNIAIRGRRAPIAVVNGQRDANANGDHTFLTTDTLTAQEQLQRLYRIADWQYKQYAPNGRPNGICWREGRGGSRGLMYVTMDSEGKPLWQAEAVTLDFTEYDYDPYREVGS